MTQPTATSPTPAVISPAAITSTTTTISPTTPLRSGPQSKNLPNGHSEPIGPQPKKIVVVGGGTGTSVVLQAMKDMAHVALTAVVVVSDNGGSTRRLRDEFGFVPVGDLRQCLAALADGHNQEAVRRLLLYRFQKGDGLAGHNLGNLILTALEDLTNSPGEAVKTAARIFKIKGAVLPVTEAVVQLQISYVDGQVLVGEEHLDDVSLGGLEIENIALIPKTAQIYPPAATSLTAADVVVLGPGDLYGSLLPNTLVAGFGEALQKSAAKFVYVVNLMTHYSQTHNLTAANHVELVEKYCGRTPDLILMHQGEIPVEVLNTYATYHEFPVVDDLAAWAVSHPGTQVVRGNFISNQAVARVPGDVLPRSVLRHDGQKLAAEILRFG